MRTRQLLLFSTVLLLIAGCTTLPPQSEPDPRALFRAAVEDAAVTEPSEIQPLRTVGDGRIRVTTWTSWDGYQPGPTNLGRAIWVTLVPEVRERCRGFSGDVDLRLKQLLGIPADAEKTRFVELEVASGDLFRPCPDPDPAKPHCGLDFPEETPATHLQWMARQMLTSYQWPGGYPWTRLGYTYDWNPGADRYGASEFLVRGGAEVQVLSITPTLEYCRPAGDD